MRIHIASGKNVPEGLFIGIITLTGLVHPPNIGQGGGMKTSPDPHYRHRFPAEIISHAVWSSV
jgi:hypothetical protein